MIQAIYRMCGIASTNPSPIFQEDKYKLNMLCLRSYVEAFKDTDIKTTYILDHTDGRYVDMVKAIDPRAGNMHITTLGINETMLLSYELASQLDDDILFQECDYLYLPNTGPLLADAVKELGLVSPYDHPDHYDFWNQEADLALINNHHFRSTRNNTMTFAVQNKIFKDNYEIFKKYGYLDHDVWDELVANGHKLYTPIPSLATHMVESCLAPSINWQDVWEEYT